jgi:hypothetical protein
MLNSFKKIATISFIWILLSQSGCSVKNQMVLNCGENAKSNPHISEETPVDAATQIPVSTGGQQSNKQTGVTQVPASQE